MENNFHEQIKKLPIEVQDFLYSDKITKHNQILREKFSLTGRDWDSVMDLMNQAFLKEFTLDQLPVKIQQLFGYDQKKAEKIAVMICGLDFMAVEDFYGGVEHLIRKWGLDPMIFRKLLLEEKELEIVEQEKEIKEEAPLELAEEKPRVISEETMLSSQPRDKPSIPSQVGPEFKPSSPTISPLNGQRHGKPSAAFYFNTEDVDEIRKIKDGRSVPVPLEEYDFEKKAEQYINDFKLSFPDDILKKRFINIIISRLRNIRKSVEIKEILQRSKKIGGLEFDQDLAEKITDLVNKEAEKIQLTEKIEKKSEPVKSKIPPPPVPRLKMLKLKQEKVESSIPSKKPVVSSPAPASLRRGKPALPTKTVKPLNVPTAPPPRQRPRRPIPRVVPPIRRVFLPPNKPMVTDIKPPVRLVGPVEELKQIRLKDFRNFGSVVEAIEKIKDKLVLLGEESFVKKAEGIAAWHQSEVNQLYLLIGRESMDQGKVIGEIINQRLIKKQPYLTEDEFEAIADLNRSIRF